MNSDGTKAGVGSEAAASFRKSKEMNLPEAYMILGVNDKTPWEDVLKVTRRGEKRREWRNESGPSRVPPFAALCFV